MEEQKKKSKLPILILSVILVAGLGIAGVLFFLNSPSQLCKKSMKAGDASLARKDYEKAIEHYLEALEHAPENEDAEEALVKAYVKYAEDLEEEEELKEAAKQYENALEIKKDKKVIKALNAVYLAMAKESLDKGNKEAAAKYLKKILNRDDEDEEALSLLARTETAQPSRPGESSDGDPSDPVSTGGDPSDPSSQLTPAQEGKVLNIYVWNEEFISRMEDHYPGYEKIDGGYGRRGRIGDVTVCFTIVPSDDNAYQDNLDYAFIKQEDAYADEKVDVFLLDSDYALKYLDTDYAMKFSELGISESDLSDQFAYTLDLGRDGNGNLKATTWQACIGGMIYNRQIARAVLGSDDPAMVQAAVADWDHFNETASKMAAAGYVTCGANDTFRAYNCNRSGAWVQNGTITMDANILKWVNDSKKLVDGGAENNFDLWSAEWAAGRYGGTFCYFGPQWFYEYCMDGYENGSVANQGGWGFCAGPQAFYWGGTWVCAAAGTDNPTLVRDIILTMTADKKVLKEIAVQDLDCVNSKSVLRELSYDASQGRAVFGGQNPYGILAESGEKLSLPRMTKYDAVCATEFQLALLRYLKYDASYDESVNAFYKGVMTHYSELKSY